MRGKATKAKRDPIDISISPEINRTANPIAATKVKANWPETFIIFLNVKKYSDAKEKKTKIIKKIINSANSPFLRYFRNKEFILIH